MFESVYRTDGHFGVPRLDAASGFSRGCKDERSTSRQLFEATSNRRAEKRCQASALQSGFALPASRYSSFREAEPREISFDNATERLSLSAPEAA
jgi:hypothetical protein